VAHPRKRRRLGKLRQLFRKAGPAGLYKPWPRVGRSSLTCKTPWKVKPNLTVEIGVPLVLTGSPFHAQVERSPPTSEPAFLQSGERGDRRQDPRIYPLRATPYNGNRPAWETGFPIPLRDGRMRSTCPTINRPVPRSAPAGSSTVYPRCLRPPRPWHSLPPIREKPGFAWVGGIFHDRRMLQNLFQQTPPEPGQSDNGFSAR